MFKDKYDTLNTSIQPSVDLVERTKCQRSSKRVYKILVSVSMICMIIGVYYLWSGVDKEIKQPIVVEEPKDKYYKDLNFASGKAVTILNQIGDASFCIVAFEEGFLRDSDEIIKITVKEVKTEEVNKEWFIIYKVEVDNVYNGKMEKGDIIYIRDPLHYTSSLGDSVEVYQDNHQYIVALCKTNSNEGYRTMYPFGAQIEITLDNEFVFKAVLNEENYWWTSLVNEKAKKIIDKEWLYYRSDADFEKDFQNIVDKYCNNIE